MDFGISPSKASDHGAQTSGSESSREEVLLASRIVSSGLREIHVSVPSIRCGGCLRSIEGALTKLEGVEGARANLSTKSVMVRWRDQISPPPIIETLQAIGHPGHFGNSDDGTVDANQAELMRALAVAGFAAGNVMLLSVSVWSGADGGLRDLFHLISALITLPVLVYSGRIFYRSAWAALRHGRTNMDVPISIGISLAFAMSVYDTLNGGPHAYFDAVVMLLFFLLIGRSLDNFTRARARRTVNNLARLTQGGASIERDDGSRVYMPVDKIGPDMTLLVAAGERIPVDACVISGASETDRSVITGENAPQAVAVGAFIEAGTLNLTNPLRLRAIATAENSYLAEMIRLMTAAEAGRSGYRRLADKASALYAPVVHGAALLAFFGWVVAVGDYHHAANIAIAVLIITCPCALGLAVPMVQVVAAGRLFTQGVLIKDGAALERLAEVDTVVFDKTGTLTTGTPHLKNLAQLDIQSLRLAASLAVRSHHPYARAIVESSIACGPLAATADRVTEIPGAGIEAHCNGSYYRLGRADWALDVADGTHKLLDEPHTVLAREGKLVAAFAFEEQLRPGARHLISHLRDNEFSMEILSGDQVFAVEKVAAKIGIEQYTGGMRPGDKVRRLQQLTEAGRRTLMIGDGLNDAPALAAAYVSMAPSSASDIGRNAADLVFMRSSLNAVTSVLTIAKRARSLIHQNFAFAILYNAVALPFAAAGFITPLVAALAMSSSSLVVVINAMRLFRDAPYCGVGRKMGTQRRPLFATAVSPR